MSENINMVDALYKTIYNQDQKIADLEAKLEELNKEPLNCSQLKNGMSLCIIQKSRIIELEAKLAKSEEKVKVGEFWHSAYQGKLLDYDKVYAELRKAYDKNEELKEQYQEYREIVEKNIEKEIDERMRDTIKEFNLDISQLKQQLEEKEEQLNNLEQMCSICNKDQENEQLKQQLAEKEKLLEINERILRGTKLVKQELEQDKISFVVEKLEEVKHYAQHIQGGLINYIENQIKSIKGEK